MFYLTIISTSCPSNAIRVKPYSATVIIKDDDEPCK